MGGFFGTVLKNSCARDLFYGVDYHSHLGTKRAGLVTHDNERFYRSIHDIENTYFRTKFSDELNKFVGNMGIGVISDTDAQPIIVNSHLGRFALCTVAKINNLDELVNHCLDQRQHFAELSMGFTNPTELMALLITQGEDFVDGIKNVYSKVKGSCSMLILTEDGVIAARDYYGRTPIVIGKSEEGYVLASESHSYINLDYSTCYNVAPGEIVKVTLDGVQQLLAPRNRFVLSFGSITASQPPITRVSTWRKPVITKAVRWENRITLILITSLPSPILASAWPWAIPMFVKSHTCVVW